MSRANLNSPAEDEVRSVLRGAHGGRVAEAAAAMGVQASELADFSANLNPLGPPSCLDEVLGRAPELVARYPEPDAASFRSAYAEARGVPADAVLAGNGSTELLYLLLRALGPRRAIILSPAYSDYERAARLAGAEVEHRLATPESSFRHDLDAVASAPQPSDAVILGRPNNPTGVLARREEVLELVRRVAPAVVVADEAFIDFVESDSEESLARDAAGHPNLFVLHSLTKVYAVPGLRLGVLIAHPDRARLLRRLELPWTVNGLAVEFGRLAVREEEYLARTRRRTVMLRQRLAEILAQTGVLRVFPSEANFLLVEAGDGHAAPALQEEAFRRKVLARSCHNFPGLGTRYLRFAVRPEPEMELLQKALAEYLGVSAAG